MKVKIPGRKMPGTTIKVNISSGTKKASAFHLGSVSDQITGDEKASEAASHKGQLFDEITKQCLRDGVLWEDPEFRAVDKSLFFSKTPPRPFIWKRPTEMTKNPRLFVDGASRFDITQGMLGDCWLLAAIASLTQQKSMLYQVVPPDIDFDSKKYCGIFRFRFWQYGKWEEVVVDDRLPTFNNKLVFLHSSEGGEFWTALMEKAYAKLHGCYESLKGGDSSEAMEDFTGGISESFPLREKTHKQLFQIMSKAVTRQSLMCCSIEAVGREIEAPLDNGLIKGHAYSITGVNKVNARFLRGQIDVNLVRIRNPWGNEREWKGAWGDGSPEWKLLSNLEKESLGLSFEDDGEFWMSFEDFCKEFTRLQVCMLSPGSTVDTDKKRWEMDVHQGSWQRKVSAGGCRNFPNSFALNPQYRIKLEDPDPDDEDDNCTVVIGLIQKDRRKKRKMGVKNLTIGFSIYKVDEDAEQYKENGRYGTDYFLFHKATARSNEFMNRREIIDRFSLPPGEYLVMPSTFRPDEEADFLVRLFSEKSQPAIAVDTKTTIAHYKTGNSSLIEKKPLDPKFKDFFKHVAGADNEIDSFELQQVITMAFKKELSTSKELSLEASRSMVAMMDRDRSGKLDFEEFNELWQTIMKWRQIFKDHDYDKSGDMDAIEMRGALSKIGFKLSTPALSSLVLRYTNKKGNVNFDDFLQICCRVRSCFESYLSYQEQGQSFTLDDYFQAAIYT